MLRVSNVDEIIAVVGEREEAASVEEYLRKFVTVESKYEDFPLEEIGMDWATFSQFMLQKVSTWTTEDREYLYDNWYVVFDGNLYHFEKGAQCLHGVVEYRSMIKEHGVVALKCLREFMSYSGGYFMQTKGVVEILFESK